MVISPISTRLTLEKLRCVLVRAEKKKEDHVLFDVGLDLHKKIGDRINKGDLLATLYVSDRGIEEAIQLTKHAMVIGQEKRSIPLIRKTIK